MAIKKDAPKQALQQDAAVDAAFGQSDPVYGAMNRISSARSNTPGKSKKRARDAARNKITFDWPMGLTEQVIGLARAHQVPANQLAAVLVQVGLQAVEEGTLDLEALKIPSRVPAFQYFLKVEDGPEK